ncbi:MAG: phosphoenolpyruvate--protein phosphotransferase, partial [Oscillospiraceae bacterium]|nr:phosphoenolpyruvate--protein phosphotransferase [Oscillospiraceae bacterium]
IDSVTAHGGDGVGLFRSEFIYLNSADFPTEEEQFLIYKEVLERLAPRPVVVRTLDLGSDKQAPYFGIEGEENPAMGYRAIRICLKEPHIFRTQMRALLRASVYGNLNVMFPMITQLGQVRKIKELLAEIKQELEAESIPFSREVQYGIMIETPAAAVMSDVLAREVDFFSIGTNDLTQYTMAADRMNARISDLFDPADPAVLRLVKLTAQNAHAAGIWVGICGESAANTALTNFYMDIGIDELSVSPASIPAVKRAVIESVPETAKII